MLFLCWETIILYKVVKKEKNNNITNRLETRKQIMLRFFALTDSSPREKPNHIRAKLLVVFTP